MSNLAPGKRSRKKQSEFQRLWTRAEKLKQKNARFRKRLDQIILRIREEIEPAEKAAAKHLIPLLERLLKLGLRKSLTGQQRTALDEWIRELIQPVQISGLMDNGLVEQYARYEAFRLGIELDDDTSVPYAEQLSARIEQEEARFLEDEDEDPEAVTREEIEKILDRIFGTENPDTATQDGNTDDLFQDDLDEAKLRQKQANEEARRLKREELLAEAGLLDDDEDDPDSDFDPFGSFNRFNSQTQVPQTEEDLPELSNAVFKRLFRSTAAQLHPDREPDAVLREQKNLLMSKLLNARRQRDIMTIVQMHQEHVGEGSSESSLSKKDEKQLVEILKRQIDKLQEEQEDYIFESPIHHLAYETFYFESQKKTDIAFETQLQATEAVASEAMLLASEITTLKTLKPHLQRRYLSNTLELDDLLDSFFDMVGEQMRRR